MWKLWLIGALICGVLFYMIIRMIQFTKRKNINHHRIDIDEVIKVTQGEKLQLAKKLSDSIKIKSISYMKKENIDFEQFLKLHGVLERNYPLVHKRLEVQVINNYSLLYRWKGKKPERNPSLYMAHMDVVPVKKESEDEWKYPPFSGLIEEGYVWGRGSLDTKVTMNCILEAAELLLEKGFCPTNDIYFAFGHDEEIQGDNGAAMIVEHLKSQGVILESVLDEGGIVSEGSIPGVNEPVALIGIGEKGYADVTVSVRGEGGHASMPPKSTALGIISKLVYSMEENQLPLSITTPVYGFLMRVGPFMGVVNRFILSNLWLFKGVFMNVFSKVNSGNALLRTTTAATMSTASNASNVLPQKASVTFNFRIGLNDSVEKVVHHIRKNAHKMGIKPSSLIIDLGEYKEPSKISSTSANSYKQLEKTVQNVFGDVVVAPYIVLAATDSYKYESICKNIYRFAPLKVTASELATIHNVNERVSVDNIGKCLEFYIQLLSNG